MCIEDSQQAAESVSTSGAAISAVSATSQGHHLPDLLSITYSPFLEHPPTFPYTIVSHFFFFFKTLKLQKLVLRSFSLPCQVSSLRASIGDFSALVFPLSHGQLQALCPLSHMTFGQLPFYLNRASL